MTANIKSLNKSIDASIIQLKLNHPIFGILQKIKCQNFKSTQIKILQQKIA